MTKGRYGIHGGQYIPETLMNAVLELEEAYNHFAKACDMDPSNPEYSAAYNQIKNQRTGAYGGYNPGAPRQGGCSGCDVCSGLLCADCCCECFGGDFIRCC